MDGFVKGKKTFKTNPRSGRPSESRTDDNIENVRQLLLQNRHLSLRMMADEPDISNDAARQTVVEDLNKRKLVLAAR
jgi:hypothetical protein